jgi:hypothetical protein
VTRRVELIRQFWHASWESGNSYVNCKTFLFHSLDHSFHGSMACVFVVHGDWSPLDWWFEFVRSMKIETHRKFRMATKYVFHVVIVKLTCSTACTFISLILFLFLSYFTYFIYFILFLFLFYFYFDLDEREFGTFRVAQSGSCCFCSIYCLLVSHCLLMPYLILFYSTCVFIYSFCPIPLETLVAFDCIILSYWRMRMFVLVVWLIILVHDCSSDSVVA